MSKSLEDVMRRIRPEADTALNVISNALDMSKVDVLSFVLLGVVTLKTDDIVFLARLGRIVSAYMELGARINAPSNISLEDEPLNLSNIQDLVQLIREIRDLESK